MQTAPEEDRFRGYAGIIRNTLTVLNDSAVFRRRYGKVVRRFLCNSPHWQYAALIIMENGTVRVEAVANKPEANLGKTVLGWNGFVEMDSGLFVALITQQLSFFGVVGKWFAGEIKLHGLLKLFILWDLFCILKKVNANRTSYGKAPVR